MRIWSAICLTLCFSTVVFAATLSGHCDVDLTSCDNAAQPCSAVLECIWTKDLLSTGYCMCCVDYNNDGQWHWVTCVWKDWEAKCTCPNPNPPYLPPVYVTAQFCSTRDPATCEVGDPPASCTPPPGGDE